MLAGLIDHAALFPPASMDLPEALAEDARARASEYAWMLARFVVPASRLAELPDERPPLSVVLREPEEVELVRAGDGVEAVELPLPTALPRPADVLAAHEKLRPRGAKTYFELVLDGTWRDSVPAAIGAVAAVGARVKVRCGPEPPATEQLALAIVSCRDAGVPFKATAGLHHPLRHEGGHGFLNLMAASGLARAGATLGRVEAALDERDAAALELDAGARELFVSLGSCSWREPVDDLRALGLLE